MQSPFISLLLCSQAAMDGVAACLETQFTSRTQYLYLDGLLGFLLGTVHKQHRQLGGLKNQSKLPTDKLEEGGGDSKGSRKESNRNQGRKPKDMEGRVAVKGKGLPGGTTATGSPTTTMYRLTDTISMAVPLCVTHTQCIELIGTLRVNQEFILHQCQLQTTLQNGSTTKRSRNF